MGPGEGGSSSGPRLPLHPPTLRQCQAIRLTLGNHTRIKPRAASHLFCSIPGRHELILSTRTLASTPRGPRDGGCPRPCSVPSSMITERLAVRATVTNWLFPLPLSIKSRRRRCDFTWNMNHTHPRAQHPGREEGLALYSGVSAAPTKHRALVLTHPGQLPGSRPFGDQLYHPAQLLGNVLIKQTGCLQTWAS